LRCEAAIAAAVDGKTDMVCAQSPWPIGEPNTAYAQYFIGNSYLAVLDPRKWSLQCQFRAWLPQQLARPPRCRADVDLRERSWWYQEWGKEAVPLVPGTVIAVPEGVKHWHGAAKDSWMQHLTYHADAQPGNSNEWLEPVSNEQYDTLK
jgi:hypothetical protein